jgi:predicted MFS family arabinose efflux permease
MRAEGLAAERDGSPWTQLFLLVVASAVFVTTMTGSMVNVVISVIRAEFGASAARIGWIVTGYALAYAVGIPPSNPPLACSQPWFQLHKEVQRVYTLPS